MLQKVDDASTLGGACLEIVSGGDFVIQGGKKLRGEKVIIGGGKDLASRGLRGLGFGLKLGGAPHGLQGGGGFRWGEG